MNELPIVLLDLDDTLLDFKKAEHIAICRTFRDFGLEPTAELTARYSEINAMQWKRLELGEINRQQVLEGRFQILFEEQGLHIEPSLAKSKYEAYLSQGHYFIPGAEELLEELHGKYRLFLCSNGTAVVQAGRLESAGIGPYFEKIFISEDIGHNKPDTRYFEACFDQIPGFDRKRCVMVGDSLSSDILGGIKAGIKTCWFDPRHKGSSGDICPDCTIYELSQLMEALDTLFA